MSKKIRIHVMFYSLHYFFTFSPFPLQFNPASPCLTEGEGFNKNPTLNDTIHCLVYVIPADSLIWCADSNNVPSHSMIVKDQDFVKKIRDVRAHASRMGKWLLNCSFTPPSNKLSKKSKCRILFLLS